MTKQIKKFQRRMQIRAQGHRELSAKYNELIMAVESKYPSETRHETALRYIKDRETMKVDAFPTAWPAKGKPL